MQCRKASARSPVACRRDARQRERERAREVVASRAHLLCVNSLSLSFSHQTERQIGRTKTSEICVYSLPQGLLRGKRNKHLSPHTHLSSHHCSITRCRIEGERERREQVPWLACTREGQGSAWAGAAVVEGGRRTRHQLLPQERQQQVDLRRLQPGFLLIVS